MASGGGKWRNVPRTPRYAILKADMLGIGTLAKKVFGTPNDRKVKSVRPLVAQVNALKPQAGRVPDLERDLAKAKENLVISIYKSNNALAYLKKVSYLDGNQI